MDLLWILFTIATADLLLAGPFASAPGCSNNAEIWCKISPNNYHVIEVSKDQPGRITCTIPHPKGLDIRIINQLGEEVRIDSTLKGHVTHISTTINPTNKSYEFEIDWPQESEIQERLRIIQCIGLFFGSRYPCRTSLVNIQFAKDATTSAEATTTSTGASTTTTELEREEEEITTTAISEDTTTTKKDEDEHAEMEKMDSSINIKK